MSPDSGNERPWAQRLLLAVLGVILLASLLVLLRGHLLTGLARYLIVADEPVRAEVAVALGGGRGQRSLEAARVYRRGLVDRVVVTGGPVPLAGRDVTYAGVMANLLAGIVPDSLVIQESRSTSTYEDALYVREDLELLGVRSALIITDPYHLRRTRATFRHVFAGSGIRLTFVAPADSWFRVERWWTKESHLIAVTEEYLKMLHYLLNHRVWAWT